MTNNFTVSLDNNSEKPISNNDKSDLRTESEISAHSLWKKFTELLSDSLKQSEINTWFSVIVPKSFNNNILTIIVPSEDYYSLIESRYNNIISKIVDTLLGEGGKLNYEITQMGLFSDQDKDNIKDDNDGNSHSRKAAIVTELPRTSNPLQRY